MHAIRGKPTRFRRLLVMGAITSALLSASLVASVSPASALTSGGSGVQVTAGDIIPCNWQCCKPTPYPPYPQPHPTPPPPVGCPPPLPVPLPGGGGGVISIDQGACTTVSLLGIKLVNVCG